MWICESYHGCFEEGDEKKCGGKDDHIGVDEDPIKNFTLVFIVLFGLIV